MTLSTTYPFTTSGNYTFNAAKIEVSGGVAKLILEDNSAQSFPSQEFSSDVGFTYNALYTEFVGGVMRQKDQGGGSYVGDVITIPTFTYSGLGSLQSFDTFSPAGGSPSETPRFVLNGLYWDGAAWSSSDDSWAQANTSTTINTNLSTHPASDTLIVKIITNTGSVQMYIDSLGVTYTGQIYPTSNPTIKPNAAIDTDALASFVATVTAAGSDAVTFTMEVDGVEKYWDGAAWSTSSGYAQSNTAADVNTNAASLTTSGIELVPVVYLHSNDGSTYPSIDSMTIGYDYFDPRPSNPNTCVVAGYLINAGITNQASATVQAWPVTWQPTDSLNFVVANSRVETTTDAYGYFELELIRSAAYATATNYHFRFVTSTRTKRYDDITVPDQASADFVDLI